MFLRPQVSVIDENAFDRQVSNETLKESFEDSSSSDFCGMHHVFDQHKAAVTGVRFAHNDKSLLACSSLDGTLSICQITPPPATVLYILRGHTAGVHDFQWSISNDMLVSCSTDCTMRLWESSSGHCLRIIEDPSASPVLACSFQPLNNNMLIAGNEKGYIHVSNVSTGILVGSIRTNVNCSVQCLTFESNGRTLWVGDSRGFIYSFSYDLTTGKLNRLNRCLVQPNSSVTSISNRSLLKNKKIASLLLVNCSPNCLIIFEVHSDRLIMRHRFALKHQNKSLKIRSTFCPITSFRDSVCIASGSEDSSIYFFEATFGPPPTTALTSPEARGTSSGGAASVAEASQKFLSSLQGHAAPVIDVSLNYDESLLASSDTIGNVIVWKKKSGDRNNDE